MRAYCQFCGRPHEKFVKTHEKACPVNPTNNKAILIWLKEFIDRSSSYAEVLVIPDAKEYKGFARSKGILGYRSVRQMFEEREWWDIIIELVSIGIENDVVTPDEFPQYYRSLYDNFQFIPVKEFNQAVKHISEQENAHLGYN